MNAAVRRHLADGRWHFQHGPIDCIVEADGAAAAVDAAVEAAWARFETVLAELVAELPLLRIDLGSVSGRDVAPRGAVARRMVAACREQAEGGRFVTAMAAVAGAVAEELIGFFAADPRIARAAVNNGGDIALHLGPGARWSVGIVADPARALCGAEPDVRFAVTRACGVRGIATSGWRGRSLSRGIADSVTVLAGSAAAADAAATLIANAVDVDDPRIVRKPALEVRDDSDLGVRLVTCAVPDLDELALDAALEAGVAEAEAQLDAGRVLAVALCLQGRFRSCAAPAFDTLTALAPTFAAAWRADGMRRAGALPPTPRN